MSLRMWLFLFMPILLTKPLFSCFHWEHCHSSIPLSNKYMFLFSHSRSCVCVSVQNYKTSKFKRCLFTFPSQSINPVLSASLYIFLISLIMIILCVLWKQVTICISVDLFYREERMRTLLCEVMQVERYGADFTNCICKNCKLAITCKQCGSWSTDQLHGGLRL